MDSYLSVADWQRAISDRLAAGDEIVTDARGHLVWRSTLEHVGYGQDIGDDGAETVAEATIDREGVVHFRTVRMDASNPDDQ